MKAIRRILSRIFKTNKVKSQKKIDQRVGSFEDILYRTKVKSRYTGNFKKPSIQDYYISTIKTLNCVEVESSKKKKAGKKLINKTINKGYIFSPEVYASHSFDKIIKSIESEVGLSSEQLNNSFHKSWVKIKDSFMERLVREQITHYITTYLFEELGTFDHDNVYIPNEKLKIPKLKLNKVSLRVIKGYKKEEILQEVLKLIKSGIAFKEETLKDLMNILYFLKVDKSVIDEIKNYELKIILMDNLGMVPENPIDFLRYLIYKTTGRTLLIKNKDSYEEIKKYENPDILVNILIRYYKKFGFKKLSSIFNRFKPLFLSFKINDDLSTIINRISKLSKKNHKPLKNDYLNSITCKINNNVTIKKKELEKELEKVNVFRRIRLLYALKFRLNKPTSILYKIRNGKSYTAKFRTKNRRVVKRVYELVLDSIIKNISENVKGKKIFIPKDVSYTLPATEKQFTDKYPNGTSVVVNKDMIFGVHWKNVENHRIDLDLSLINASQKFGWNAAYRNKDRSILFSGDMTDAPHDGATELFYVKKKHNSANIIILNYYNYRTVGVPFKFIIAKENAKDFKKNYMVNPNNIVMSADSNTQEKQKMLGLLISTNKECKFYFNEIYLQNSIVSSSNKYTMQAREYLIDSLINSVDLEYVLVKAGAKVIRNKTSKFDIDLSSENLNKNSILNLIIKS